MPKSVSIYIPTHNRPHFLARALDSLLNQTYSNIQVLVCDDGSSVSYQPVIEEYRNKFTDIHFLRNEQPKGACHSRNRLINMADGEYVTGLDDDDEFLPTRVADFINASQLDKYPYLCAGHITKMKQGIIKAPIQEGEVTLDALLSKNVVGNQIFTRTKLFRDIKGFDEELPAWQDYDAWVRMAAAYGSGYKLDKHNYQWNIDHEENRISNSPKAQKGYEMFVKKHKPLLNPKQLASLFFQDKINRNQEISFTDLSRNFSLETMPMFIKYKLNRNLPFIKKFLYGMK